MTFYFFYRKSAVHGSIQGGNWQQLARPKPSPRSAVTTNVYRVYSYQPTTKIPKSYHASLLTVSHTHQLTIWTVLSRSFLYFLFLPK